VLAGKGIGGGQPNYPFSREYQYR